MEINLLVSFSDVIFVGVHSAPTQLLRSFHEYSDYQISFHLEPLLPDACASHIPSPWFGKVFGWTSFISFQPVHDCELWPFDELCCCCSSSSLSSPSFGDSSGFSSSGFSSVSTFGRFWSFFDRFFFCGPNVSMIRK